MSNEGTLTALKQHHDELDAFFQERINEVQALNEAYRRTAVAVDIIASVLLSLYTLSVNGYKIAVLGATNISRAKYAFDSLLMAYRPVVVVLRNLHWKNGEGKRTLAELDRALDRIKRVGRILSGITSPSAWARIITNLKEGHWRDAFSRHPEAEMSTILSALRQQRATTLEKMERSINTLEVKLGRPLTLYVCRAR
jgi:hypothetical protein